MTFCQLMYTFATWDGFLFQVAVPAKDLDMSSIRCCKWVLVCIVRKAKLYWCSVFDVCFGEGFQSVEAVFN